MIKSKLERWHDYFLAITHLTGHIVKVENWRLEEMCSSSRQKSMSIIVYLQRLNVLTVEALCYLAN